ncbi:MAG: IPT/TIG domain-containing protein [Deltaproteobacteria bacterium]|nr:IPT/TIG domain-containing protein [Deltaproteobacteria bacterium]
MPPPILLDAQPQQAFAGAVVVLHGSGWGALPQDNIVRVGNALAQVTAVEDDALQVIMPALGPVAQDAAVSVTVAGQTGHLPGVLHYRGPGHAQLARLHLESDLSAQPAALAVNGNWLALATTRQDQLQIENFTSTGTVLSTYFTDPTVLPLRGFLTNGSWWTLGHRDVDFSDPAQLTAAALPPSTPLALQTPELPGVRVWDAVVGQRGPIRIGAVDDAAAGLHVEGAVETSAIEPDNASPGADRVAVVAGVDGGHEVSVFEIPARGKPLQLAQRPLALPPGTALGPVALTPDLETLLALAQTPLVSQVMALDLSPDAGAATPLTPFIDGMDAIAASDTNFAVATGHGLPYVRVYDYDGVYRELIPLASSATVMTRDSQPPFHIFVAQPSPPEVLELDYANQTVLQTLPLSAGLNAGAFSPSGARFAVSTYFPCQLAVMDSASMEVPSRGGMSAGAQPGDDSSQPFIRQLGWPNESWVCGTVNGVKLVCSHDNDFFSPDACVLPLPQASQPTARLSTHGDGKVYASADASSVVCDLSGGCPTRCSPTFLDGQIAASVDLLQFSADGQHALATDSEPTYVAIQAFSTDAGASIPPLVVPDGVAYGIAVHPSLPLGVVAARPESLLVNLDSGQVVAHFDTVLAPARSAGFSPDGSRVYLGTELGDVIAYDLAGLQDGAVPTLRPEGAVHAGFSIETMIVDPTGSRLIVFSSQSSSDALWVVE